MKHFSSGISGTYEWPDKEFGKHGTDWWRQTADCCHGLPVKEQLARHLWPDHFKQWSQWKVIEKLFFMPFG